MHVLHTEARIALRAIAMLVVVALALLSVGVIPFSQKASAANLTNFSDTLSDSDLSVVSNHTLRFTIPNGMLASQDFTVSFPGFTIPGGFDFNDVDIMDDGVEQTLGATNGAAQWGVVTAASTTITFTAPSVGVVSSSSVMIIQIGTHATSGATGDSQMSNPVGAGSVELTISGSMVDSGQTQVAILNNVDVTANVNTSFTFTVTGMATSSSLNGTSTTKTSTATSIPFGTLVAGVIDTIAQRLNVTTNASQGFSVTVYQDANFLSSTGADIDGFTNGTYVDDPEAWSDPLNSIVTGERTWGHWGLTTEDDVVAGGGAFGSNEWISASTTPRSIFHHNGPSDGLTDDIGSTTVGYQVQITSLQEAGDDYNTTLTYIATPVF